MPSCDELGVGNEVWQCGLWVLILIHGNLEPFGTLVQKLKVCQHEHIAHTVTLSCNGAAEVIRLAENMCLHC